MMTALTVLIMAAAAYLFVAVFALMTADSMIFQPRPSSYRKGGKVFTIPADDGTPLAAMHLEAEGAPVTVLFLHGNAEDLGDILPLLEEMRRRGLSVLAYDYRGYGTTPGKPNEAGIFADTGAVYRHLVERIGVPPGRVLVYGRSVGSGPAVELAAREPVGGLVLDGAFTSAFRVMTQIPLLPGDRFKNIDRMPRVRCPVLVIHGTHDRTIPIAHGRALYQAARGPRRNLWVDGAGHNDLVEVAGERYWDALVDFARAVRGRWPPAS